jgi:hypothetical protein
MPKKEEKGDRGSSKKVNVEIAPGNKKRLNEYIKSNNEHPDRSRPALTLTDVINEALDEFFSRGLDAAVGDSAKKEAPKAGKGNEHARKPER